MISKTAGEEAKKVLGELSSQIKLIILKDDSDRAFTSKLSEVACEIAGLSPLISVESSGDDSRALVPAIWIQTRTRRNFFYSAIPTTGEFMPFVRTLVLMAKGQNTFEEIVVTRLNALDREILLEVLITENCPFCPKIVELASRLAAFTELVKVHVIDIGRRNYASGSFQVRSVPAIIVNGKILFMGIIDENGITDLIEKATDETKLLELLASNLLMGNAGKTLEIILEKNRPALLVELMAREEFTVRLGAVMLIETLQAESPGQAKLLVPGLIALLKSEMLNVRGDAAYLLGVLGDKRATNPLRELLSEKHEDLLEIVKEALNSLENY